MAVVENRVTEIGDTIWIKVSTPIVGLVALTNFIDDTDDESGDSNFYKRFRYSLDGVIYSDWAELTIANLQAVPVTQTDTFFIEYQYERQGNDGGGSIAWNSSTLTANSQLPTSSPIYDSSVFAQFFSPLDVSVLNWAINVLEKVYQPGLVAQYVTRTGQLADDLHFIQFWRPICAFWAYLVNFARVFEAFRNNDYLADLYLNNFQSYTCGDESIDQLLYIVANQFRIKAQRGTFKMYEPGSGDINDSDSLDNLQNIVDGELLRLICWTAIDFFKLGLPLAQYTSWNIGNSSPCYRGLTRRIDMNLGYEDTLDFVNLSSYPRTNPQYTDLYGEDGPDANSDYDSTSDSESTSFTPFVDDKRVMRIQGVPIGQISGIGNSVFNQGLVIDPGLGIEITFYVKQVVQHDDLTFGVKLFDLGGNVISAKSVIDGSDQSNFFTQRALNRTDKYYFVRGIVYPTSQANLTSDQAKLNIGFGNHLRFPASAVRLQPYIVMDQPSTINNRLQIWNVKVTPVSTEYSRCFLNNRNFIDVILKNRNTRYSNEELYSILRQFFVPYNSSFKVQYL